MSGQTRRLFREMYRDQLSVKHELKEWSRSGRERITFVQHIHTIDLSVC